MSALNIVTLRLLLGEAQDLLSTSPAAKDWNARAVAALAAAAEAGTPAAQWRATGEEDPHAGRYDRERAALCMGDLTDDELANEAFLHYDVRPPVQALFAGTAHAPIAWMTAVKDRIRWLSRALERELASRVASPAQQTALQPDDARLLQLLEDICRAAGQVDRFREESIDQHGQDAFAMNPDTAFALRAALVEAAGVPEPDFWLVRKGWLRVIETLRRRLALIAQPQTQGAASLSDEQIDALYDAHYPASSFILPGARDRIRNFTRAALAAATSADAALNAAARDVLAERARCISAEGWTPAHDDEHDAGELAAAAAAYAIAAADALHPLSQGDGGFADEPPVMWPWAREWWKPGPPRRMLEKSGQLVLAQMECLDRAAAREAQP